MANIAKVNHCSTDNYQAIEDWVCGARHMLPDFVDRSQEEHCMTLRLRNFKELLRVRNPDFLDWTEGREIMISLDVNKPTMVGLLAKLLPPANIKEPEENASLGALREHRKKLDRWAVGIYFGSAYRRLRSMCKSYKFEREQLERDGKAILAAM